MNLILVISMILPYSLVFIFMNKRSQPNILFHRLFAFFLAVIYLSIIFISFIYTAFSNYDSNMTNVMPFYLLLFLIPLPFLLIHMYYKAEQDKIRHVLLIYTLLSIMIVLGIITLAGSLFYRERLIGNLAVWSYSVLPFLFLIYLYVIRQDTRLSPVNVGKVLSRVRTKTTISYSVYVFLTILLIALPIWGITDWAYVFVLYFTIPYLFVILIFTFNQIELRLRRFYLSIYGVISLGVILFHLVMVFLSFFESGDSRFLYMHIFLLPIPLLLLAMRKRVASQQEGIVYMMFSLPYFLIILLVSPFFLFPFPDLGLYEFVIQFLFFLALIILIIFIPVLVDRNNN